MPDRATWTTTLMAAAVTCGAALVLGPRAAMPLLVVGGGLVAAAVVAVAIGTLRHAGVTRALRACSVPQRFADIDLQVGDHGGAAFVAGLARPTIFCDRRLLHRLSNDELYAVVMHERAHQLARDPVRMVATDAVAPVVGRLPAGRAWLSRLAAEREIAADAAAVAAGASRAAIASALLKVQPAGRRQEPDRVPVPGFTPAVDARLLALLEDGPPPSRTRPWPAVLSGTLLGAALCML